MGVYIKGVDLPDDCASCLFSDYYSGSDGGLIWTCTANGMELDKEDEEGRQPGCPMVYIPAHGPLMDIGAPYGISLRIDGGKIDADIFGDVVIPAEEE